MTFYKTLITQIEFDDSPETDWTNKELYRNWHNVPGFSILVETAKERLNDILTYKLLRAVSRAMEISSKLKDEDSSLLDDYIKCYDGSKSIDDVIRYIFIHKNFYWDVDNKNYDKLKYRPVTSAKEFFNIIRKCRTPAFMLNIKEDNIDEYIRIKSFNDYVVSTELDTYYYITLFNSDAKIVDMNGNYFDIKVENKPWI